MVPSTRSTQPAPLVGERVAAPRVTPTPSTLRGVLDAVGRGSAVLVHEDPAGGQHLMPLAPAPGVVTLGRGAGNDLRLAWDVEVSRLHCQIAHFSGRWLVEDIGLSRNGTFVNGTRVAGRHWLHDGDRITVGDTELLFRAPAADAGSGTVSSATRPDASLLTPAQRRVLAALCRPLAQRDGHGTPATNRQIADELFLTMDTVKAHLRAIARAFELDHLGQNERRLALAQCALRWGLAAAGQSAAP